ncbi:unnamed protein product, partial [Ectocarpus sp. 6 AP-2014]
ERSRRGSPCGFLQILKRREKAAGGRRKTLRQQNRRDQEGNNATSDAKKKTSAGPVPSIDGTRSSRVVSGNVGGGARGRSTADPGGEIRTPPSPPLPGLVPETGEAEAHEVASASSQDSNYKTFVQLGTGMGRSAMGLVVQAELTAFLKAMIRDRLDVNSPDSDPERLDYRSLHWAAYSANKDAIEILLDVGADITMTTIDVVERVLHVSIVKNNYKVS